MGEEKPKRVRKKYGPEKNPPSGMKLDELKDRAAKAMFRSLGDLSEVKLWKMPCGIGMTEARRDRLALAKLSEKNPKLAERVLVVRLAASTALKDLLGKRSLEGEDSPISEKLAKYIGDIDALKSAEEKYAMIEKLLAEKKIEFKDAALLLEDVKEQMRTKDEDTSSADDALSKLISDATKD